MAKGKTDKIVVEMDSPEEKKRVKRFFSLDPKDAVTGIYVEKDALAKLGDPDKIIVTIEAAD